MKIGKTIKKLFHIGSGEPQFSLGDKSWRRPDLKSDSAQEKLGSDLARNRKRLESVFELPTNKDIVIRDFQIPVLQKDALIIYIDGLTDRNTQNFAVLEPLMILNAIQTAHYQEAKISGKDLINIVYDKLLPEQQVTKTEGLEDIINGILEGNSIFLMDGSPTGLIIETKGWEHRGVDRPANEPVVRGPQEGFTETFRANTAAIRRYIKDPKLISEIFRVGKRSRTLVSVMYIKDIANPRLVEEVKYRIQSIADQTDYISESGALEEYIEDHPRSLLPQMLSTERPDRVAAHLREGHVGIVMANSPFSLVIPATFTIFLHAAEDYYLRWPFGNFLRVIRTASIFIALLFPAIYVGVINYHQEMVPTDLLLSIASAREAVPFPAFVEILFMEFSFELIREAGIRIPSVIGPTIGIVGALILGQAAVAASIVSPILIIVIAITAISSFVVPNYNASFAVRLLRFAFIALAGFLGFFGIAFGIFIFALHLAKLSSFGVPFLTPIAPYKSKNRDRVLRPPGFSEKYRPLYLRPLDWIRQSDNTRPWDNPHKNPKGGAESGEQ